MSFFFPSNILLRFYSHRCFWFIRGLLFHSLVSSQQFVCNLFCIYICIVVLARTRPSETIKNAFRDSLMVRIVKFIFWTSCRRRFSEFSALIANIYQMCGKWKIFRHFISCGNRHPISRSSWWTIKFMRFYRYLDISTMLRHRVFF